MMACNCCLWHMVAYASPALRHLRASLALCGIGGGNFSGVVEAVDVPWPFFSSKAHHQCPKDMHGMPRPCTPNIKPSVLQPFPVLERGIPRCRKCNDKVCGHMRLRPCIRIELLEERHQIGRPVFHIL